MKNFQNNGTKLVQRSQSKIHFRHLFLLLAIAAFGFVGCEKNTLEETSSETIELENEEGTQHLYFLDLNPITQEEFNLEDETFQLDGNVNIEIVREEKDGQETIKVLAFTDKDLYIQWGKEMNRPIEETLQFEEYAKNYALENNLLEVYESTGEIPERYLNHLDQKKIELFTQTADSRGFAMLRDGCDPGPVFPAYNVMPVLPLFNNQTSSVEILNIYGSIILYENNFFNTFNSGMKMTLPSWGLNILCINNVFPPMNNVTSSCIVP